MEQITDVSGRIEDSDIAWAVAHAEKPFLDAAYDLQQLAKAAGEKALSQALDGSVVELPTSVREVVTVPVDMPLTTTRAAHILGMSRPSLVKLLETGEIPFHRVGRDRRVMLSSAMQYVANRRAESLSRLAG